MDCSIWFHCFYEGVDLTMATMRNGIPFLIRGQVEGAKTVEPEEFGRAAIRFLVCDLSGNLEGTGLRLGGGE